MKNLLTSFAFTLAVCGLHATTAKEEAFIEQYLLEDTAVTAIADSLFEDDLLSDYLAELGSNATYVTEEMGQRFADRGFRCLQSWNILVHELLPGYVVKLPKTNERKNNIDRIWTAKRLQRVIDKHSLTHVILPHKQLYHIPGKDRELSSKNYLVFAQMLDVLCEEESDKALKQLSGKIVGEVETFITKAQFRDVRGNIRVCSDRETIAVIDTEDDRKWDDIPVEAGLAYFQSLTRSPQKEIVVIVPSYNNAKFYEKNLESLLGQKYDNFEVIYIDDASQDGTGDLVAAYVAEHGFSDRFKLLRNKENKGVISNLYHVVLSCESHKIIVELDGDDWFAHDQVLSRINQAYQEGEVWLTFGNYIEYPSGDAGWSAPFSEKTIRMNTFRACPGISPWVPTRSYYAWLFKKIKLKDLQWRGRFMPMSHDEARMYAMIEMAGERHRYIEEILYEYNRTNPISDDKKDRRLQERITNYIITKQRPYQRLAEPVILGASTES